MSDDMTIKHTTKHTASFGGMCWPQANPAVAELGWMLRYGEPTKQDLIVVASVVDAYVTMVHDPREKRERVIRALREAAKMEPSPTASWPFLDCEKGGLCMWKIDGQHSNEYCGKCYRDKPIEVLR